MDIFPEDVREAAEKLGGDWISSKEFDAGLTLQVAKPFEKVQNRYGAEEDDFLVERGILSVGEVFLYTFRDEKDAERKITSKSAPLFLAFKQSDVQVDDWVKITRTGKTDKTRYTVEKAEKPLPTVQLEEARDIPL